ncbi:MAG: helix-turn-helix transcriptional regulator [Candidatus Woesearchaeota archaeon]
MNQKYIGIIVLIIGILLIGIVTTLKINEDKMINEMIHDTGSCFLDDGTCLHSERDWITYIIGWILSSALIILGLYLIFFDKTQQVLLQQNSEIAKSLVEAKKKEEFNAFLSGFDEQQQKVLRVINNEEGILQSTLRYRVEMSKTSLSILLRELEDKGIILRKTEGKSNKVFLRKKW